MPQRLGAIPRLNSPSVPSSQHDSTSAEAQGSPPSPPRGPGVCLLNASNDVIAANDEASRLLAYPESARGRLDVRCLQKIRALVASSQQAHGEARCAEIRSGRRRYLCRTIPLTGQTDNPLGTQTLLLIERPPTYQGALARLSADFHVTRRELEVVDLLARGLTNKEIASAMRVSANTVKTLVHFIMIKLRVSTRSGIVGALIARTVGALIAHMV